MGAVGGMARRSLLVVTAYILIQTEVGKAAQVAKDIVEITGVQQAEDVTGPLRRDRPRRGAQPR